MDLPLTVGMMKKRGRNKFPVCQFLWRSEGRPGIDPRADGYGFNSMVPLLQIRRIRQDDEEGGEKQFTCVPVVVAFRGATGYRPPGCWVGLQPDGIPPP